MIHLYAAERCHLRCTCTNATLVNAVSLLFAVVLSSQQQNALGYNLSMQGIGDVAIDGPRLEEFFRSRKDFFEVSQVGVSQGGLAIILLLGCTAGLIHLFTITSHVGPPLNSELAPFLRGPLLLSWKPVQRTGPCVGYRQLWLFGADCALRLWKLTTGSCGTSACGPHPS